MRAVIFMSKSRFTIDCSHQMNRSCGETMRVSNLLDFVFKLFSLIAELPKGIKNKLQTLNLGNHCVSVCILSVPYSKEIGLKKKQQTL